MDIQHIRHRAALLELQLDIDRVRAMTERRLRDIWAPAPPEQARLCRLPACRRHGACRSDRIRRACALAPGAPGARMEPPAAPPPDQPNDQLADQPPIQPATLEADRPGPACPAAMPEPQSPPPAPDRPALPAPRAAGEQGYCPADFRPAADCPPKAARSDAPVFGDLPPGRSAPFEAEEEFVPPARIPPPLPRLRVLD